MAGKMLSSCAKKCTYHSRQNIEEKINNAEECDYNQKNQRDRNQQKKHKIH